MNSAPGNEDDEERFRRESLGAFAHDIRTPLTSVRMVISLAEREAAGGAVAFDHELMRMLKASIDNLETLVDDFHALTRLERGRLTLSRGPCALGDAIRAAAETLAPGVTFAGEPGGLSIEGPWDGPRLTRALVAFAVTADRAGAGAGVVTLGEEHEAGSVRIVMQSGVPGDGHREISSDLGFPFFQARALIVAMGGAVECEREDGYFRAGLSLPLA